MASKDSSRKVSSVFITLATPQQTKAKQQSVSKKGWVHAGPSQRSSGSHSSATEELSQGSSKSENRTSVHSEKNVEMLSENDNRDSPPISSPPSELHSYPPDPLPTPTPPPAQKPISRPPNSPQLPPYNNKVVKQAASSGTETNKKPNGIQEDNSSESRGLCGICRKPVLFSEAAVSALKRIYHKGCFMCKTCCCSLAGKTFYDKEELPECEECYENSLERCWSCGERIRERLVRALQRTYHPTCFICVTCKQPLQDFIQADSGEVYCHLDYSRKFAKTCSACHQLIMASDGSFPEHIESDGRIFHGECYRCEVCNFKFSLEKDVLGCYSVNGKRLCLTCSQQHQGTTG